MVIECVLIEYEKKKEGNNQCQCGSWQCICQWHIWLFTQGIDETPFYIQIFVGTSHFHNYSYYLVRLLQISVLGVEDLYEIKIHFALSETIQVIYQSLQGKMVNSQQIRRISN